MFHSISVSIAHFLPLSFTHRLGDRIEDRSSRSIDTLQDFLCTHIVIFGKEQGKSYRLFRIDVQTRKRDISSAQGDELGRRSFLHPACTGGDDAIGDALLSIPGCKKRPHGCTVLLFIVVPDERPKILSRRIFRLCKVIEILDALSVVSEYGHTCCTVLHRASEPLP